MSEREDSTLAENDLDYETFGGHLENQPNPNELPDNQCSICKKRYKNPKVLNCLHYFCEQCLVPEAERGSLHCTICARVTSLDTSNGEKQHVRDLLPAYVAANMVDMEAVHDGSATCTSCKSAETAIARCADCAHFLCPSCNTAHEVMRCFENHRVLTFAELLQADAVAKVASEGGDSNNNDKDPIPIHRPVVCLRHPVEHIKFFCFTCQEAACSECIGEHQVLDHVYERAADADAAMREELGLLVRESQRRVDLYDEESGALVAALTDLESSHDNARTLIDKHYEKCKLFLERIRDETLDSLKQLHNKRELEVMEQFKRAEKVLPHDMHAARFAQRLLILADAPELLASKRTVTQRLRDIVNRSPLRPLPVHICFQTDIHAFNKAVQETFGRIYVQDDRQPTALSDGNSKYGSCPSNSPDNMHFDLNNLLNGVQVPQKITSEIVSSSSLSTHSVLSLFSIPTSGVVSSGGGSPTSQRSSCDSEANAAPTTLALSPFVPSSAVMASNISTPGVIGSNAYGHTRASYAAAAALELTPSSPPSTAASAVNVLTQSGSNQLQRFGIDGYNLQLKNFTDNSEVNSHVENPEYYYRNLQALAKMADNPVMNVHNGSSSPLIDGIDRLTLGNHPLSAFHEFNGINGINPYNDGQYPIMPSISPINTDMNDLLNAAVAVDSMKSMNGVNDGFGVAMSVGVTSIRACSSINQFPTPRLQSASSPSMNIRHKFGQLGTMPGHLNSPHGFCLGNDDEIIVADTNNHRIQIFDKTGEFKFQFGSVGKEEGNLYFPRKVAMIKSGKFVVCDRGNERSRMQIFNKNGHFMRKISIRYMDIVAGLAVTQSGEIVAVDSVSPTVFVLSETGDIIVWFDCSNHMREPSDIAVHDSLFYICDFKGHCVVVFNSSGQFMTRIGCEGVTNFPNGIDISDEGNILIGDSHGNRFHVVVYSPERAIIKDVECPYVKVSRCCGLKVTKEGNIVTLAKNNHHVLVLGTSMH